MGLAHSPRIVTDGIVLALDAQNSKSWKSGTTWTDTFGGNNGTLTGGTSHSDGPFPEAGYVEFDGSTEYLSIADSADFDLGSGDFTIEGWAYLLNASGTQSFVCKGTGTDNQASYAIQHTGTNWVYYLSGNGSTWSIASAVVMGAASANGWYHIALVRSGSTFTPYINGTAGTTTSSSTSLHNSNKSFTIGSNDIATHLITGNISNVRVVKGTALYTSDFTPPSSPLTAVTNTKLLCCQGGTNVDASPSAHSFQVIIGVPTLTSVGPSATKYFEFDGSNDYIDLGDTFDDIISGANKKFTIESWVNPDSVSGNKTIVSKYGDSNFSENTRQFQLRIDGDEVKIYVWFGQSGDRRDYATSSANLTAGSWHHIVLVYDGSIDAAGRFTFYVNGQNEAATETYSSGSWGDIQDTTSRFAIGAVVGANVANSPLSPFDGKISNTKIYSRLLTAAEVEQNYNATKGRYV